MVNYYLVVHLGNHDATVVRDVPKVSDLWEIAEIINLQWPELARMLSISEENSTRYAL